MAYFLVSVKHDPKTIYVTAGENSTDAVLRAYEVYAGHDRFEDHYEEAGGGNELAESCLAEVFDCTETYRAMVLEMVERRLDGDHNISIIL